jgi:hypothetical protein
MILLAGDEKKWRVLSCTVVGSERFRHFGVSLFPIAPIH